MEANELRIGNLVTDSIGIVEIGKNAKIEFCDIYNPITLTEDILLKCGFFPINDSCGYYKEFLNKHKRKYKLTVFLSHDVDGTEVWACNHSDLTEFDTNETFCSSIPIDIDYLHQLQNLYFALTGNELNVNKQQ